MGNRSVFGFLIKTAWVKHPYLENPKCSEIVILNRRFCMARGLHTSGFLTNSVWPVTVAAALSLSSLYSLLPLLTHLLFLLPHLLIYPFPHSFYSLYHLHWDTASLDRLSQLPHQGLTEMFTALSSQLCLSSVGWAFYHGPKMFAWLQAQPLNHSASSGQGQHWAGDKGVSRSPLHTSTLPILFLR